METAERSETLFVVETLEHLRRGGRIGHAAALLGTALAVKPVLRMVDGEIRPLEKVRTMQRAMNRLVELVAEAAGTARCRWPSIIWPHPIVRPDSPRGSTSGWGSRPGVWCPSSGPWSGRTPARGCSESWYSVRLLWDEPPCRPVGIVGVRTVPVVGSCPHSPGCPQRPRNRLTVTGGIAVASNPCSRQHGRRRGSPAERRTPTSSQKPVGSRPVRPRLREMGRRRQRRIVFGPRTQSGKHVRRSGWRSSPPRSVVAGRHPHPGTGCRHVPGDEVA